MKFPGDSATSLKAPVLKNKRMAHPGRSTVGRKLKGFMRLIPFIIMSVAATAQDDRRDSGNHSGHVQRGAEPTETHVGRRDPFLNPLQPKKKPMQDDGVIPPSLPPRGIAGTPIAELLFEGTSFREGRKLAIVRGSDRRIYFLKKGARFFDGYLKTIQTDSIVLVRETKLKSGKVLTQDVIKRLRKP
jgi:hypothetical protein